MIGGYIVQKGGVLEERKVKSLEILDMKTVEVLGGCARGVISYVRRCLSY